MHDQPDVYPCRFIEQQQLGGGGGGGGESSKDKKERKKREKEQEKREKELFKLQQQQIAESRRDAERARKQQEEAQASIRNQNAYQSILSKAGRDVGEFVPTYDPNRDYLNSGVSRSILGAARTEFSKAQAKQKADEARQAKEIAQAQKIAPIPTEYAAGAEEASFIERSRSKRRRGIAASIFAGETGGYNTEKKTLLG